MIHNRDLVRTTYAWPKTILSFLTGSINELQQTGRGGWQYLSLTSDFLRNASIDNTIYFDSMRKSSIYSCSIDEAFAKSAIFYVSTCLREKDCLYSLLIGMVFSEDIIDEQENVNYYISKYNPEKMTENMYDHVINLVLYSSEKEKLFDSGKGFIKILSKSKLS